MSRTNRRITDYKLTANRKDDSETLRIIRNRPNTFPAKKT